MYFVIVYNRPPAQKQKREFSIEDPFSFCKNKKQENSKKREIKNSYS